MVAVFFLLEVVVEVVAEVAGAVHGAELEDGFGAIQAPLAPVTSSLSLTIQRAAPSMRPLATGHPAARKAG